MTADTVLACDAMAPSSFIIGSPFANFEGDGMKEYLNHIYTAKGTFRRVENYRELIEKREKP
jgi:FMN-dependent NADH-azoreductase